MQHIPAQYINISLKVKGHEVLEDGSVSTIG
jgi:hypothetical protein